MDNSGGPSLELTFLEVAISGLNDIFQDVVQQLRTKLQDVPRSYEHASVRIVIHALETSIESRAPCPVGLVYGSAGIHMNGPTTHDPSRKVYTPAAVDVADRAGESRFDAISECPDSRSRSNSIEASLSPAYSPESTATASAATTPQAARLDMGYGTLTNATVCKATPLRVDQSLDPDGHVSHTSWRGGSVSSHGSPLLGPQLSPESITDLDAEVDAGIALTSPYTTHLQSASSSDEANTSSLENPLFVSSRPPTPPAANHAQHHDPSALVLEEIYEYLSELQNLSSGWREQLQTFFCMPNIEDRHIDLPLYTIALHALTTESCAVVVVHDMTPDLITDATLLEAGFQDKRGLRFAVVSLMSNEGLSVAVVDSMDRKFYCCGMEPSLASRIHHFTQTKFLGIFTAFQVVSCAINNAKYGLRGLFCLDRIYHIMKGDLAGWTEDTRPIERMTMLRTVLGAVALQSQLQDLELKKRPLSSMMQNATGPKRINLGGSVLRLASYQNDHDDPSCIPHPAYVRETSVDVLVRSALTAFTGEPEQQKVLWEAWTDPSYTSRGFADYRRFRTLQMMMSFATPEALSLYLRETASMISVGDADQNTHNVHELIQDIRGLLRDQNSSASQLRRSYVDLFVQHKAKVVETQARLDQTARRAKRGLAKPNPAGVSAENVIDREYRKLFSTPDYHDFKRYISTGEVLKIIADSVGTASVICLFPCDTVQSCLTIEMNQQQGPHWIRKAAIRVDEYHNMKKVQAMFFAKWLVKIRPKLARLRGAKTTAFTRLVQGRVVNDAQEWLTLPPDSDEFLDLLTKE